MGRRKNKPPKKPSRPDRSAPAPEAASPGAPGGPPSGATPRESGGAPVAGRGEPAGPAGGAPPAWWLPAWLLSLVVGLGAATYLTGLHVDLVYGAGVADSLCDLGAGWSCSSVNASEWSTLGPFPVALLAVPVYVALGYLGARAARSGRASSEMALLVALATAAFAFDLYLAAVSALVIRSLCLFCVVLYVVGGALVGLAFTGAGTADLGRRLWRAVTDTPVSGTTAAVLVSTLLFSWLAYGQARNLAIAEATAAALATEAPSQAQASGAAAGATVATVPVEAAAPPDAEVKQLRIQAAAAPIVLPTDVFAVGPASAPVTVAAFLDFQCPFCRRLAGTLEVLHEEFPDQVRIAYLQFPMQQECNAAELARSLHPEACAAAKAAVCAGEQGRFVEAHDLLFQESGRLGPSLYMSLPSRIGLDPTEFEACVARKATTDRVRAESAVGAKAGVNGTPTVFVNGRMLSGAQPIEVFRAVVNAELERNTAVLDLEVAVGTERIGTVQAPEQVAIELGAHPFAIDAFESALEGERAVSKASVPVARGVTWYEAKAACEATGKRLCTEEEWLTACSGARPVDANRNGRWTDDVPTGRFFAYGNLYQPGTCADARHPERAGEIVAGVHPECVTEAGVYDLNGNVKEWVGTVASDAAVMGGSYFSEESARCTYHKDDAALDARDPSIGFRCCSGAVERPDTSRWAGGKVGDRLRSFELETPEGGTFSSADLAGHPAIVTFWASWCGPCRVEMPILSRMQEKYREQGLRVLGISIDEQPEAARTFLMRNPMSFAIALDPRSQVYAGFEADSIPTTFWIRPDGTIVQRTVGVPEGGEERIEQLVQQIVAAPER